MISITLAKSALEKVACASFCLEHYKRDIMKVTNYVLALALFFSADTLQATTVTNDPIEKKIENMTPAEKNARADQIRSRVEEIRKIDRSSLTREDRKALRKELRDLNKESKALGRGGVYLSLGGILLIILILILIL